MSMLSLGNRPRRRRQVAAAGIRLEPLEHRLLLSASRSTLGLHDPTSGTFFLREENSPGPADLTYQYGPAGSNWLPVVGDWNGDLADTAGLFDPVDTTYYLRNAHEAGGADLTFVYGPVGHDWLPIAGDWNGDGVDTIGLYAQQSGIWYLRDSNTAGVADYTFQYGPGQQAWLPVVGDWDGDGTDSIGLYEPISGVFFLRNDNSAGAADITFTFGPGGQGWEPLTGDWDDDQSDEVALYHQPSGFFFLRNMHAAGPADLTVGYGPAGTGWDPLAGTWSVIAQSPVEPVFDLHPDSDTAPLGDMRTEEASVTLVGQTSPAATVKLLQTGAQTTADASGNFTFAAVPLSIGDNLLTVRATDAEGNQNSFVKTITRTTEDNQPPEFSAIGALSVMPGQRLEVPLVATDGNGDPITFSIMSAAPLPTGMLETNSKLVFTPSPAEVGSYEFTVVASDGIAKVSQQVTLDVVADPVNTTRISGRVLDVDGTPIAGVPVSLARITVMTDQDGNFTLELPSQLVPTEDFAIEIPQGDVHFDPFNTGNQTISFRRARFDTNTGTSVNDPRQHPNLVTTFIDASIVYGSDEDRADALRTFSGGKLKSQVTASGELLPQNNGTFFPDAPLENDSSGIGDPTQLFVGGDVRASENVALAALHTILLREHNRLADELGAEHPLWTDEEIYQHARRLVGAIVQHITYSEYLPLLLGSGSLPAYAGYDDTVDPRSGTLFTTAAFRIGHTQMVSELSLLDSNNAELPGAPISLRDAFFNSQLILDEGIEPVLRGMAGQLMQEVDPFMVDELRNFLFGPPGAGGNDLAAMNIQRGRDMGLPSYNQARQAFGLPVATTFADISSDVDIQSKLATAYGSVDLVDAWVGGIAEDRVAGALVGPLFRSVMLDQFMRLRSGDRFWYENEQFVADDLAFIRSTTLADLITRNTSDVNLPAAVLTTGTVPSPTPAGGTAAGGGPFEFRTIDGANNNLLDPSLGQIFSHLRVDAGQHYADGISAPAGGDRPNARVISNEVLDQSTSIPNAAGATTMAIFWGQILSHDLALSPTGTSDTLRINGDAADTPGKTYPFVAEKLHLLLGHDVYEGADNVIARPIFLPALDMANAVTIDPNQDTTVTTAAIPGMSLEVTAGNLLDRQGNPFSGQLSITQVPAGQTPAALPEGLLPNLVVTIQPAEMTFVTPAPITFPNTAGWAPGRILDLWSINPTTGEFEIVGQMQVSADGTLIETISGGIRTSSWHLDPPPPPPPPPEPDHYPDDDDLLAFGGAVGGVGDGSEGSGGDGAEGASGGMIGAVGIASAGSTTSTAAASRIEFDDGALTETHALSTYHSLEQMRGVSLHYDSLRADSRYVIQSIFEQLDPRALVIEEALDLLRLASRVTVQRGNFVMQVPGFEGGQFELPGGEHFWNVPHELSDLITSLQIDLTDLPSGEYDLGISRGLLLFSPFQGDIFTGSLSRTGGSILHVNTLDSPFGAGWGIDGLQQVIENPNGSLLLVDGNGNETVYENPVRVVRDFLAQDTANDAVARHDGVTGAFLGNFVASGAGGLDQPHNPTFGPDGNLYVVSGGTQQILRYDGTTGAFIDVFVDAGVGGFTGSSNLAFDADGTLYAASATALGVLRYDQNGTFLGAIAGPAQGVQLACGIEIGPDGLLYVYDTGDEEMRRFNRQTGALVDVVLPAGTLSNACDFAFGPNGDIFITDATFNQVRRYSSVDGSFLGVFSTTTGAASGVTFGPDGNFYVNVAGNTHRFDGQTGAFIDVFVPGKGGFNNFFPGTASQGATVYTSQPGDFHTMERLADGTYRRTTTDQTITRFDTAGRIVSETDRNGNATLYEYDGAGNLERIVDPVGLATTFNYTAGRVSSIVDPAGRTTSLQYDAAGNLTHITDPDGSARQFTYDTLHHMTGELDQRGNFEQTVWDEFGRVTRAIRKDLSVVEFGLAQTRGLFPAAQTSDPFNAPLAASDLLRTTTVVDGNGNLVTRVLNGDGRLISQSDEIGAMFALGRDPLTNQITSLTNGRGNVLALTYDDRGNVVSAEDTIDAGNPWVLTYDPTFSQLTGITDALGRMILFDVNPLNGNLRSVTRVVGALGGNDDVVTQFTYTPQGLVETSTDALGRVTSFDYDAFGRRTQVTFAVGTPDEATAHFEYDDAGNQTAYIDENGNRTEYQYDLLNRLVRIVEPDPDGGDPLSSPITEFAYDAAGNQTSVTDARGNTTVRQYDSMHRPTSIIDALGNTMLHEYDGEGNLVATIDANGNETQYLYDARNRRVQAIDPAGGTTVYSYDLDNNLVSRLDASGNLTQYAHDLRGRLETVTDPLGNTTTHTYDLLGNRTSTTDRNGRVTQFTYDDLNRLVTETWVGGGNTIQYTYDKVGNVVEVTDNFSSLAVTYDNRNRVETVDNAGTPDAPHVTLHYTYDAMGNVLSVADEIDGAAAGTNEYVYDGLNRVIELRQQGTNVADKLVTFAYDALGQVEAIARFSDLLGTQTVATSTYVYDALNRSTNLAHASGLGTLASFGRSYDAAGRVVQGTTVDGTTTYAHDTRDQLVSAQHSDPANPDESYAYDATGNRTSSHLHNTNYTTGPHNQLLSDGVFEYDYDAEGSLVLRTEIATGMQREFEWDHRNRLTAVIDKTSGGTELDRVEFTYDAIDRRISKTIAGAVDMAITHFVNDGDGVLLEFVDEDGTGGIQPPALTQRYLHGPMIDSVLAQDDGAGNVLWQLTDHQQTVTDLVNGAGQVVHHVKYDSYGNVIAQSGPATPSPYKYLGEEFDDEIGLYYLDGRYYDPQIGRYLNQSDPQAPDANPYRHAMNMPLADDNMDD